MKKLESLENIVNFCNSIIALRDKDESRFVFPPEDGVFCVINFTNGRWGVNYRHIEDIKEQEKKEFFPTVNFYSYEVMLPYSVNIVENILGKLKPWPLYAYQ